MFRTEKHEWEESEKQVMVGMGCLGGDHARERETDSGIERLSSAGGRPPGGGGGGSAAPGKNVFFFTKNIPA
jgi:hypothetical protein